jgi:hypothetical protein
MASQMTKIEAMIQKRVTPHKSADIASGKSTSIATASDENLALCKRNRPFQLLVRVSLKLSEQRELLGVHSESAALAMTSWQ